MENIVAATAVKSVLLFLEWNDLELPTHGLPDFFHLWRAKLYYVLEMILWLLFSLIPLIALENGYF